MSPTSRGYSRDVDEPSRAGATPATELTVLESLDEVVETVRRHGTVFVRYSTDPEEDLKRRSSRDYEADVDLPGLSVTVVSPEPWWPRPTVDWVARRLCKYAELGEAEGRFPWLLTGRVVGNGPDHEPLVDEVRPIARISESAVREAVGVYRSRFEAGQSSRD
jgi:hypothetical protein